MNPAPHVVEFSDSDNSSSIYFPDDPYLSPPDVESLRRFSDHVLSLLKPNDVDSFADACIVVGAKEFPVHRCVLSARSLFFRDVFTRKENTPVLPVRVEMKELVGDFVVGSEAFELVLEYLYSGRLGQLSKGACLCVDEECSHVGCRPALDFFLEVLYSSFIFKIFELVSLFQRQLLDILGKVAIDDIPVILSVANLCDSYCERLLNRCIEIVVKSDIEIVTLEKALPLDIVKQVTEGRSSLYPQEVEVPYFPDKYARKIYKALDSDDIELVKMLLEEGHTSLDDVYALHYAVAHCDTKITMELLDLNLVDVNHRNPRGYSVLHVAALRKEPKIIISLLTKGARPSDLTLDGRKPAQISKRLTKSAEFNMTIVDGKVSPDEGRLCIGILEHAERRNPLIGVAFSLEMAGDDLRERLLYLENRVALARMLFPKEAKVAMDIARVNGTLEFSLGITADPRSTVDLNKTPYKINEEHLARMEALARTVGIGKSYFPRCSEYLDKIMDDDIAFLEHITSNKQMKKIRELQDIVNRTVSADDENSDKSASSTSPSMSIAPARKRSKVKV